MLRTALVALLVGAVLSGCGIRIMKYEFEDDRVVAEKFASVRVRTHSGDVTIRSQQGLTETKIHRRVEHKKNNKPETLFHRVEGDALVLEDCGDDCTVNYDVLVPSADVSVLGDVASGNVRIEGVARVEYKTGSGSIVVRDVKGDVRVIARSGDFDGARIDGTVTAHADSGNMRLDELKGKVTADSSSGDIIGFELDNDVFADAKSGNVKLTFVSPRGVQASTGSGDITVQIPGGPFKVTGDTNSGERRIDVPTSATAQHELKLNTASGNVRVLTRAG